MKAKRKLIISVLIMSFVLLAAVATIAVTFALTQQNITTSLNIGYEVQDIDGSVYATYTIGDETNYLVPSAIDSDHVSADGNSLIFKAEDLGPAGTLEFPIEELEFTSANSSVVIQYTYSNTGDKHYIASMSFDAQLKYNNMKVEYGIWDYENGEIKWSKDRYAVVVPANSSNKSYWIRISIDKKAKDASFIGDFNWLLEGCDEQAEAYKFLTAVDFVGDETTGTYSASYNGNTNNLDDGKLIVPSSVNGSPVTTISTSTATPEQKAQVKSVYIPDSVETIGSSAFENFTNLETVTFKQNETSGSASVQALKGLTMIGANAFKNCTSMIEMIIPDSVKTIGIQAFNGCTSLTEFLISSTVITCDQTAFANCVNLKDITTKSLNTNVITAIDTLAKANGEMNLTICGVTSIGASAFKNRTGLTNVTFGENVTTIGNSAFYGCKNLTEITMSDSVTTLDNMAFYNCTSLTNVTFGENVTTIGSYAFNSCSKLTSITIPDSVTTIGSYAFQSCSGLTSVTIGNGVETIGSVAFYGCSKLTSITIPDSVTTIGSSAFSSCSGLTSVSLGKNITTIESGAFGGCSKLTSIIIPKSVTSVGSSLFSSCSALTELLVEEGNSTYHSNGNCIIETATNTLIAGCNVSVIPTDGSVTTIGTYAFFSCSKLTSITIPDTVITIENHAFKGCSGLTSIIIPDSVTTIGTQVFNDCTKLTSATIGSGVTSISIPNANMSTGAGLFIGCNVLTELVVKEGNTTYHSDGNCIIETATNTLIAGCKTSVIPTDGSVTIIGKSAFSSCSGLTSITIPDTVITIEEYAFVSCKGLTSIIIPDSVTTVGKAAFWYCSGLTSVTIGENVTSLGSIVFMNCSKLTAITIPDAVTAIGERAFKSCSKLTSVTFENANGWFVTNATGYGGSYLSSTDLANRQTAATYLTSTYSASNRYWTRK